MRSLYLLLLTSFCFIASISNGYSSNQANTISQFWSLQEYSKRNEQQRQSAPAFAKRIADPAEAYGLGERKVRIAIIYPGKQASDYWRRSASSFQARLREIGVPFEVQQHFSEFETNASLQAELISSVLKSDPDYLVFTLDAIRHQSIVERLIARGRPKVILQNITTPLKSWGDKQPFLYVGFDHVSGTELLIDYYRQRFGEEKAFAVLYGPRGYVSRARGDTFVQAYADHEVRNLKASYYVGYDRVKSANAVNKLLNEHQDLAFIYACSTDIALGVLDAVEQNGLTGKVITNGWGGGSAELDAVEAGILDVTVMRMNDDNGIAMAEAIALDQAGRGHEIPLVYSGSFELVQSSDSKEKIEALKKRAFRYSK